MAKAGKNDKVQTHSLGRYIDDLIRKGVFRTKGEFAAACGTPDSVLNVILNQPGRRLSVEQCLRLALAIKEPVTVVLRRAGRAEAAQLWEDLTPQKRTLVSLTRTEREVIKQWREITTKDRNHVSAILEMSVELERARMNGHVTRSDGASRSSRAKVTS